MPSPVSSLILLALAAAPGTVNAWPVKQYKSVADGFTEDGSDCDPTTHKYLQVEAYDFHQHPNLKLTWRQVNGPCGESVAEEDRAEWTGVYDTLGLGDEVPDEATGRVQLDLFVCAPFGDYELELVVLSTTDDDAPAVYERRSAWEIENGEDEFHIWDSVTTLHQLDTNPDYSPTTTGTYTWPIPGTIGYYKVLYSGPLPPLLCPNKFPAGTTYVGCYDDSGTVRTFTQAQLTLGGVQGETGMNAQRCSDFCAGYDYFGMSWGFHCYCGTEAEFNAASSSARCGQRYRDLCYGASDEFCGGIRSLSVYSRTGDSSPAPTPAPVALPPTVEDYEYKACLVDSSSARIMTAGFYSEEPMSAAVCFGLCNDGINTHFGTQYAFQCFCGIDTDVSAPVADSECNIPCRGTDGEDCGGYDRMSTYEIVAFPPTVDPTPAPTVIPTPAPVENPTPATRDYEAVGCLVDSSDRIMSAGFYSEEPMSAEVCFGLCNDGVNTHFGTQYSFECFCGIDTDVSSPVDDSECDRACAGTEGEICGGSYRMSTYAIVEDAGAYQGCWNDVVADRAMSDFPLYALRDTMTIDLCVDHCANLGSRYAGVQYAFECFCSDTFDKHGPADESVCDTPCVGDETSICGGTNALSVYYVPPQ